MDRLGMCMDELRVLARSNDLDRAVLVEAYIDTDLTTETVSVWWCKATRRGGRYRSGSIARRLMRMMRR